MSTGKATGNVARRGAALLAACVVLGATLPARAQLSGASSSASGSTCGGANNGDGYCASSTSLPVNTGSQIQSRYAWNINADTGIGSTRDTSGTAQHTVSFNATAPGSYRLDVSTSWQGDINRVNDASGCSGSADVSGVTGSSNVALASGALGLPDPGGLGSGGSTTSTGINQTASAVIGPRLSNGAAQAHSLTFTWNGSVRSNSCEAAVRIGQQNGSTTGCGACEYPGSPSRTQGSDGHVVTINFTSFCGDGVIDGTGEQCDQGGANGSAGSCCTSTCQFRTAGQVCRAPAGVCDVQETCSGSSGACPADALASSGTVCRAPAGVCDVAETCSGAAAACPADAKSTAVCRAAAGACDVAEACDGAGDACPADAVAPAAAICRAAAGACDLPEACDGTTAACPADAKSTAVCRTAAGACDVAEACSGAGDACPADAFAPATTVCRAGSGDACDPDETCTGAGAACPGDAVSASGTPCRAGSGDACDPSETCTGVPGEACPADSVRGAFVTCRPAAGACDVAETCPGTAGQPCPADATAPSTTTCRPSSGLCDLAESCDGSTVDCPADAVQPSTVTCRLAAGPCDVTETCDGSSAACPADAVAPPTTVCRAAAGACDLAESCDGIGLGCPADAKSAAVCRAATGACDVAETCDGVANACPADTLVPANTICRPATSLCDLDEVCTGSGGACPADTGLPDTDGDTVCDALDNCDATGNPDQRDDDGDARGNACDPCTNVAGTTTSKATLILSKIQAPANDDRLTFKGFVLGAPASPAVDPVANGLRILVSDSTGATPVDITIPGGAYDAVDRVGWKVNGSGTAWKYANAGSPVPLVSGITRAQLKGYPSTPGKYKFAIKGKDGSYAVNPANLPLVGTLVIDAPTAGTGQCGETAFLLPPSKPSCSPAGGRTVKCR